LTLTKFAIKTKALIDTGATGSCVSRRFAESVKLNSFKMTKVFTAQGPFPTPMYRVDVLFPHGILFTNMDVTEFSGEHDFDFIIGMNILRKGDIAITNANDETVFSFRVPSDVEHINFVKDKNK
jgi:predicted aspartyl protease